MASRTSPMCVLHSPMFNENQLKINRASRRILRSTLPETSLPSPSTSFNLQLLTSPTCISNSKLGRFGPIATQRQQTTSSFSNSKLLPLSDSHFSALLHLSRFPRQPPCIQFTGTRFPFPESRYPRASHSTIMSAVPALPGAAYCETNRGLHEFTSENAW